jgi:hypothetical protein
VDRKPGAREGSTIEFESEDGIFLCQLGNFLVSCHGVGIHEGWWRGVSFTTSDPPEYAPAAGVSSP